MTKFYLRSSHNVSCWKSLFPSYQTSIKVGFEVKLLQSLSIIEYDSVPNHKFSRPSALVIDFYPNRAIRLHFKAIESKSNVKLCDIGKSPRKVVSRQKWLLLCEKCKMFKVSRTSSFKSKQKRNVAISPGNKKKIIKFSLILNMHKMQIR